MKNLFNYTGQDDLDKPIQSENYTIFANKSLIIFAPLQDVKVYRNISEIKEKETILKYQKNIESITYIGELILNFTNNFHQVCDACEGNQYVDYKFKYQKQNFTITQDCPVCNGIGNKIRNVLFRISSENNQVDYELSNFRPVIELADNKAIKVFRFENNYNFYFKIDDFFVFVASSYNDDDMFDEIFNYSIIP